MIDEAKMADPTELSPRAAMALLSLQLRSTVQSAVEAEAEADAIDGDAALWQLRSRLAPLIEDRRRALDGEVAAERERAAEQIAAAHVEADRIVAEAVAAAAERRAAEEAAARAGDEVELDPPEPDADGVVEGDPLLPPPVVDVPEVLDDTPTDPDPTGETELFDDPMVEWAPVESDSDLTTDVLPAPSPPALLRPPLTLSMPRIGSDAPPPPDVSAAVPALPDDARPAMQVVIDADSFARAFAAAIAPVIEARQQVPSQMPPGWAPYQAPPPKRSFWSHAWHPDVLLSGLAMVIVIIVLIAWTG